MRKKVLIIGANGQMGRELVKTFNSENVIPLTRNELDILDFKKVKEKIEEIKPDILINTAAFHKTDECEKEIERSFAVNAFALKNLAEICKEHDATLVHFSTDYVFDGKKGRPYTEEDMPFPLNVYGISKLAGEYFVRGLEKHLLIRTAYLFGVAGSSQKRTNLVETLLEVGRKGKARLVDDHIFSPTYAIDLAEKVRELIERGKYGLYHLTNMGECSVYDFARKIYEIESINPIIEKTSLSESNSNPSKAKRPYYSVLNSINLKKAGISEMRRWEEALEAYFEKCRKNGV